MPITRRAGGGPAQPTREGGDTRPAPAPDGDRAGVTAEAALREEIQRAAYCRYLVRGGREGGALEDWLAAEREVLARRGDAGGPGA